MLSIQDWTSAAGAILLFATNFLCIQVTGIFTLYAYGIHRKAKRKSARLPGCAFVICCVMLGVVAVPLYFTSARLGAEADAKACLENYIGPKVEAQGWRTQVVVTRANNEGTSLEAQITVAGPPPFPDLNEVDTTALQQACPTVTVLEVNFLPAHFVELT
jgi:uncharacterized membrane protein